MEKDKATPAKGKKITLYIDADDTILNSSEVVIAILNKRYNISPPKTIKDLRDWRYRSIYKDVTIEEIQKIYESEEFYDMAAVNEVFLNFYKTNKKHFEIVIVTKGTDENLIKKEKFLKSVLGDEIRYVGLRMDQKTGECGQEDYDKSSVNMKYGIQIDDRTDALRNTNAPIKILYKHDSDTTWNCGYENLENFYAVDTWRQIVEILLFVKDNHFMFLK